MLNNLTPSCRFVLEEAGACFVPRRGGELESKFGITLKDFAAWRGDATPSELKELTEDEALEIYEALFWNALRADLLPPGLDYFLFDTASACGIENAQRWLRLVAGASAFDIEVDDGIISLISKIDPEISLRGVEFFRRRRFRSDPRWRTLGPAWTNRCNRAKRRALKMMYEEL